MRFATLLAKSMTCPIDRSVTSEVGEAAADSADSSQRALARHSALLAQKVIALLVLLVDDRADDIAAPVPVRTLVTSEGRAESWHADAAGDAARERCGAAGRAEDGAARRAAEAVCERASTRC